MENETPYQVDIAGHQVTIRPLGPGDVDLERAFIDNLSPQSKHYRFLGGVNHLSNAQLKKLCDIDFDHRMAFMASVTVDGKETEIGVSRYAEDAAGSGCEFAVTVADDWQHKGLGTLLMHKLIDFARDHKVKRLYSVDLADNAHMRQLAQDLGMQSERDPDDVHQVIYSLTLD